MKKKFLLSALAVSFASTSAFMGSSNAGILFEHTYVANNVCKTSCSPTNFLYNEQPVLLAQSPTTWTAPVQTLTGGLIQVGQQVPVGYYAPVYQGGSLVQYQQVLVGPNGVLQTTQVQGDFLGQIKQISAMARQYGGAQFQVSDAYGQVGHFQVMKGYGQKEYISYVNAAIGQLPKTGGYIVITVNGAANQVYVSAQDMYTWAGLVQTGQVYNYAL